MKKNKYSLGFSIVNRKPRYLSFSNTLNSVSWVGQELDGRLMYGATLGIVIDDSGAKCYTPIFNVEYPVEFKIDVEELKYQFNYDVNKGLEIQTESGNLTTKDILGDVAEIQFVSSVYDEIITGIVEDYTSDDKKKFVTLMDDKYPREISHIQNLISQLKESDEIKLRDIIKDYTLNEGVIHGIECDGVDFYKFNDVFEDPTRKIATVNSRAGYHGSFTINKEKFINKFYNNCNHYNNNMNLLLSNDIELEFLKRSLCINYTEVDNRVDDWYTYTPEEKTYKDNNIPIEWGILSRESKIINVILDDDDVKITLKVSPIDLVLEPDVINDECIKNVKVGEYDYDVIDSDKINDIIRHEKNINMNLLPKYVKNHTHSVYNIKGETVSCSHIIETFNRYDNSSLLKYDYNLHQNEEQIELENVMYHNSILFLESALLLKKGELHDFVGHFHSDKRAIQFLTMLMVGNMPKGTAVRDSDDEMVLSIVELRKFKSSKLLDV